jgi:glycerol-3-phosphate acyltransferase PlsY
MPLILRFFAAGVFAYMLGAIPSSYCIGRLCFHLDLREHGSGNLGATNAFRVLGARAGICVLVADFIKGFIPVMMVRLFLAAGVSEAAVGWLMLCASLFAVVGHAFSPYIGFHGGKGVATTAGVMLAMMPQVFMVEAVCFIALACTTRYISLASMGVAVLFPVWTLVFTPPALRPPFLLLSVLTAVFVIWLHRGNIGRLRAGTEPRFAFSLRGSGVKGTAEEDGADTDSANERTGQ